LDFLLSRRRESKISYTGAEKSRSIKKRLSFAAFCSHGPYNYEGVYVSVALKGA
jgi:hypothetical protein